MLLFPSGAWNFYGQNSIICGSFFSENLYNLWADIEATLWLFVAGDLAMLFSNRCSKRTCSVLNLLMLNMWKNDYDKKVCVRLFLLSIINIIP